MADLKKVYTEKVVPALREKFGFKNPMETPRLEKIVINMAFGIVDKDTQKSVVDDLARITGQKPVLCTAKKSVSNFKLREGMVIGASYASDEVMGGVSGLATAIVIGLHNVPEGMAVSVPLAAGGMGKAKATFLTAITGAPTILGAMLGYFLGTLSPLSLALSLSFASGAMLYVVLGELLPEAILMWRSKAPAFAALAGLLVGVIILYV